MRRRRDGREFWDEVGRDQIRQGWPAISGVRMVGERGEMSACEAERGNREVLQGRTIVG